MVAQRALANHRQRPAHHVVVRDGGDARPALRDDRAVALGQRERPAGAGDVVGGAEVLPDELQAVGSCSAGVGVAVAGGLRADGGEERGEGAEEERAEGRHLGRVRAVR